MKKKEKTNNENLWISKKAFINWFGIGIEILIVVFMKIYNSGCVFTKTITL